MVLQMSKLLVEITTQHCRYELHLLGSKCWLLQAPSPFSITGTLPVVEPEDSLAVSMVQIRAGTTTVLGKHWLFPYPHPGLSFPTGGTGGSGRPLCMVQHWLGEGLGSQCVAAPLNPLMQPVLVSVVQGRSSGSPLHSRTPLVESLGVVSCFCEGVRSAMTHITIVVTSFLL